MKVRTFTHDGSFEVALSGRLTSADLVTFRELLSQIKESKCNLILIDLRAPQGNVKSLLQLGRFETLFNVQF